MALCPWDRGAVVLVYGAPGTKSTLVTQAASAAPGDRVLYVTGEETSSHVEKRARRIRERMRQEGGVADTQIMLVVEERDVDRMIAHCRTTDAQVLVVDSIWTIFMASLQSKPGSPSQIRACTDRLVEFAASSKTTTFLVGYATKTGHLAGPKTLEHSVCAVFELAQHPTVETRRVLRCEKNRHGPTSRIDVLEMQDGVLREVTEAAHSAHQVTSR